MLATQSILSAALLVVGFTAWWLLRARSISSGQSTLVVVVAMWLAASAVVWWRGLQPAATEPQSRGRSQLVQSLDTLAWPNTSSTPAPAASPPVSAMRAASVESLVGGLEARLAADPNDADGWALLAQSYAYTSNADATERAVQRAVALGFDKQALRERVASAQRGAPVGDWFDRMIPAKGP
jgi:cytochrome c-type biogenesis protein CcmH/NrfG